MAVCSIFLTAERILIKCYIGYTWRILSDEFRSPSYRLIIARILHDRRWKFFDCRVSLGLTSAVVPTVSIFTWRREQTYIQKYSSLVLEYYTVGVIQKSSNFEHNALSLGSLRIILSIMLCFRNIVDFTFGLRSVGQHWVLWLPSVSSNVL